MICKIIFTYVTIFTIQQYSKIIAWIDLFIGIYKKKQIN